MIDDLIMADDPSGGIPGGIEYNPVDDQNSGSSGSSSGWLQGILDIGSVVSQTITSIGQQQTNLVTAQNAPAIAKTASATSIANVSGINGLIPIGIILTIIYFIGKKVF